MNKEESTNQLEYKYPEFAARLKESMDVVGYNNADLSRKTNINYEMIRRYAEGYAMPRTENLKKISTALSVPAAWLQFGGDAHIAVPPPSSHIEILENHSGEDTHYEIKRYDINFSAGVGNCTWIVREDTEDPIVFRQKWFRAKGYNHNDLKGIYVRGDSMEPELHNYDTVIIDVSDTDIADGEIYALIYKNKLYIKQLRQSEDGVDIISINKDYETMHVTPETLDQFKILGRKVWRGG